ncbi:restriction endonuclease [Haloarcula salina]|uniref:Restriction endonuclease n=1 Tax=Haloarcula salina TaxID=1429914 RepID=A0AA41G357_9EURY|nr:restriction endonuclease [Haloarcula salina]MBV0903478.1 restriction endonuclease [Haloarcula salina]
MSQGDVFPNDGLDRADLVVDAVYKGGSESNLAAATLPDLLNVGNSGGFRKATCQAGSVDLSYVVLFHNASEPSWPDKLDPESGIFTYFGDNRKPGSRLHEPPGNKFLRKAYESLHNGERTDIPPILIFSATGEGYDRRFRGLAVPGTQTGNQSEDLVAVWKNKRGERFQNYRARFTILDVAQVSREWIEDLEEGNCDTDNAPDVWLKWRETGTYTPLKAERTKDHRSKEQQLPSTPLQEQILKTVYSRYTENPTDFEYVATAIFELMDDNVGNNEITRETRDGGIDATGKYNISPASGPDSDTLVVEFALEAKCHHPDSGNGVREISRLISRLRHRQFGVFVTTSYLAKQAYKEIKEDDHPVLVLSGGDIAEILIENGFETEQAVKQWLDRQEY